MDVDPAELRTTHAPADDPVRGDRIHGHGGVRTGKIVWRPRIGPSRPQGQIPAADHLCRSTVCAWSSTPGRAMASGLFGLVWTGPFGLS